MKKRTTKNYIITIVHILNSQLINKLQWKEIIIQIAQIVHITQVNIGKEVNVMIVCYVIRKNKIIHLKDHILHNTKERKVLVIISSLKNQNNLNSHNNLILLSKLKNNQSKNNPINLKDSKVCNNIETKDSRFLILINSLF